MEIASTPTGKPSNASAGLATAPAKESARDLLTRKDFGLHLTGRVDSVTDLQHREGKSAGGKEYSFYQQTATLSVGGQMFEAVFRADKDPGAPLCPFDLDEIVRIRVENPRIFNGKVSFDVAK